MKQKPQPPDEGPDVPRWRTPTSVFFKPKQQRTRLHSFTPAHSTQAKIEAQRHRKQKPL